MQDEEEEPTGTVVFNEEKEEPESNYMDYIRNMDLDANSPEYMKRGADSKRKDLEEYANMSAETKAFPEEYRGYTRDRLVHIMTRLEKDMEVELEQIRARYENKLRRVRTAIEAAEEKKAEFPSLTIGEERQEVSKINEINTPMFLQKYKNLQMSNTKTISTPCGKIAISITERKLNN